MHVDKAIRGARIRKLRHVALTGWLPVILFASSLTQRALADSPCGSIPVLEAALRSNDARFVNDSGVLIWSDEAGILNAYAAPSQAALRLPSPVKIADALWFNSGFRFEHWSDLKKTPLYARPTAKYVESDNRVKKSDENSAVQGENSSSNANFTIEFSSFELGSLIKESIPHSGEKNSDYGEAYFSGLQSLTTAITLDPLIKERGRSISSPGETHAGRPFGSGAAFHRLNNPSGDWLFGPASLLGPDGAFSSAPAVSNPNDRLIWIDLDGLPRVGDQEWPSGLSARTSLDGVISVAFDSGPVEFQGKSIIRFALFRNIATDQNNDWKTETLRVLSGRRGSVFIPLITTPDVTNETMIVASNLWGGNVALYEYSPKTDEHRLILAANEDFRTAWISASQQLAVAFGTEWYEVQLASLSAKRLRPLLDIGNATIDFRGYFGDVDFFQVDEVDRRYFVCRSVRDGAVEKSTAVVKSGEDALLGRYR